MVRGAGDGQSGQLGEFLRGRGGGRVIGGMRGVEAAVGWINTTNSNISSTTAYELSQNFPNPFNGWTTIRFSIKYENKVVLKEYDLTGRVLKSLVNGVLKPGTYYYSFGSAETASGIYFYKIITDDFTDIKRMVMIK